MGNLFGVVLEEGIDLVNKEFKMKFSKNYSKLKYNTFTTIRQNKGYYKEAQTIVVKTPTTSFYAEIVAIRNIRLKDITETIAQRDADCSQKELIDLMKLFYKNNADELILITLMKK